MAYTYVLGISSLIGLYGSLINLYRRYVLGVTALQVWVGSRHVDILHCICLIFKAMLEKWSILFITITTAAVLLLFVIIFLEFLEVGPTLEEISGFQPSPWQKRAKILISSNWYPPWIMSIGWFWSDVFPYQNFGLNPKTQEFEGHTRMCIWAHSDHFSLLIQQRPTQRVF